MQVVACVRELCERSPRNLTKLMRGRIMLDLGTAFNLEEPGVSHKFQHVLAEITLETSEEVRHRRHPGEISQVRPAGLRLYVLKDEVSKHQVELPCPELGPIGGQHVDRLRRQRPATRNHRLEIEARDVLRDRLQVRKAPADSASEVENPVEPGWHLKRWHVRSEGLPSLVVRENALA